MRIALATYHDTAVITQIANEEDARLTALLTKNGHEVKPEVWNDPAVSWQQYELVLIKSTWDYTENIVAFTHWLQQLEQWQVPVLNPLHILFWNLDKHYLQQIASDGLPVIPTLFLEKGAPANLATLFRHFNTRDLIVKPCVSAGSVNTYHLTDNNHLSVQPLIDKVLQQQAMMVQPFIPEIKESGEWSFLFFNGRFSHALVKKPQKGDFRVQAQFGGSVEAVTAPDPFTEMAANYIRRYAKGCLYARVDGVIIGQQFFLMELELLEPYLFLSVHPGATQNYYTALCELIPQAKFQPSF